MKSPCPPSPLTFFFAWGLREIAFPNLASDFGFSFRQEPAGSEPALIFPSVENRFQAIPGRVSPARTARLSRLWDLKITCWKTALCSKMLGCLCQGQGWNETQSTFLGCTTLTQAFCRRLANELMPTPSALDPRRPALCDRHEKPRSRELEARAALDCARRWHPPGARAR